MPDLISLISNLNLPSNILFDIAIIIIVATLFAYLAKFFKQPLILAYILTGLIIGPFYLGLIKDLDVIRALAEIGVAFLLFVVGLELNFKKIKEVGFVVSFSGIIKIVILSGLGYFIALLFGFVKLEAFYLASILAFSSTAIVIQLLSNKREIDTLHGKILIGILILEDIIAILLLAILSTETFNSIILVNSLLKGIILLIFSIIISTFILPSLFAFAAKSQELLFLSAVATVFFFSFTSYFIGFSIVIGAFIAGVTLANLPYNLDIIGEVKPLRDFFMTIFFVSLGMQLSFTNFNSILIPLIIFLALILIVKPIIITSLVSLSGYKKRTSFLSGIYLAQISEFSLILISQAFILGHVSQELFSLTVLIAIITMIISSYYIQFSNRIYNTFSGILGIFDKLPTHREELEYSPEIKNPIILIGGHRTGRIIIDTLKKLKTNLLVIDYHPDIIRILMNQKVPCIYGDATNLEIRERIDFKNAKMIISTVNDKETNLNIIKYAKKINPKITIFVSTIHMHEAKEFYKNKADYVILPHILTGERISHILESLIKKKSTVKDIRRSHLEQLNLFSKRFFQLTK